ncbi:uncharacterized protein EDB93DRAFT_1254585 [Suillus bovinus]|uniref:uncharacterized protein n=1 Tax=Suillus bovinus TaxID=48563 RepID=UPI001B85EA00|nr:uncharacterized protein EDB93DRAFT_1254585 [Suillus bovinus]KAG2134155.1 hypothetical protein EDB93DRAFT_1254585 [Suillus bovinus]
MLSHNANTAKAGRQTRPAYVLQAYKASQKIQLKGIRHHSPVSEPPHINKMHASFFTARLVALAAIVLVVSAKAKRLDLLPADCTRQVTVKAGDTCDKISAEYGVSTYQLAAVNKDIVTPDCSNLFAGQNLCIAVKDQDCKVTHVVKAGETCKSVADKAGASYITLLANNPNVGSDCAKLYPGEVLCTAKQIYVNTA